MIAYYGLAFGLLSIVAFGPAKTACAVALPVMMFAIFDGRDMYVAHAYLSAFGDLVLGLLALFVILIAPWIRLLLWGTLAYVMLPRLIHSVRRSA